MPVGSSGNHRAGTLKQSNKKHKTPGGTRPSRENRLSGRVNKAGGNSSAAVGTNNPNNGVTG